jgi:hypothetical protein
MNAAAMQSDATRARLRAIISSMDEEMAKLTALAAPGDGTATGPVLGLWRSLVDTLDLGPAPRLRSCPVCGHRGMVAATLCGHCWSKLTPLPV